MTKHFLKGVTSMIQLPVRPWSFAATTVAIVLLSGMLGGSTNVINGSVSREYFQKILGWHDVQDVHRAAIAQGIFEGLLFGIAAALIYTVAAGIMTGAAANFWFLLQHGLGILAGAYVCWIFGGLAGVGLAALSPDFYRHTFNQVPAEFGPMLRFAWVGGSIWGVEFGGFMSLIVGLMILRANWRQKIQTDAAA